MGVVVYIPYKWGTARFTSSTVGGWVPLGLCGRCSAPGAEGFPLIW